jgi:hypothetical protein
MPINMDTSVGIPGKLVNIATPAQVITREQADKDRRAAWTLQTRAPILALAAHVRASWDAAQRAKTDYIERSLLESLRQKNGIYDPHILGLIRKFGGSEVYMQLTNVKCRAAKSWIRDILIPPGEKPWSIGPTPVPDLPDEVEDEIASQIMLEVKELVMQQGVGAVSVEQVQDRMLELKDKVRKEKVKRAKTICSQLEFHIEDELREGNFYNALDDFLTDLVSFPTAFLEGPIVKKKKKLVWTTDQSGRWVPAIDERFMRVYERVSPFDMYPSPGAKHMQDGYLCRVRRVRRPDLEEMIGVSGFREDAIRGALHEYGQGGLRHWLTIDQERANAENRRQEFTDPDQTMDVIEYWGSAQGLKLLEWGMPPQLVPDPVRNYNIVSWLLGGWVLMARINPHPLGHRPYYGASFEQTNDSIWGKCPPQLMRDLQLICNATARNLVNNLAIASGPQVEIFKDRIDPSEDIEDIYPWKIWKTISDDTTGKPAVNFFQPDPIAEALMRVYEYFFKQSSEQTGIPAYIYGNENIGGAGKTASGLSMLMNAASKTLKQVVANLDVRVIKPAIWEHWLQVMLYDQNVEKTGDINIVARASEHLIIAEQLQLRRSEFLDKTGNPIDMAIIGEKGRAVVLRETAKTLKLPSEDVVPTKDEMEAREQALREAQQGMIPPEGQPGQPSGPMQGLPPGGGPPAAIPPPEAPGGGRPGEQVRLNA